MNELVPGHTVAIRKVIALSGAALGAIAPMNVSGGVLLLAEAVGCGLEMVS